MGYTPEEVDAKIQAMPEMIDLVKKGDETRFDERHAQIYNEHGLKPDGTPFSVAKQAIKGFSKTTGIPEAVTQFGASSVLPAIGTAAGMAAGASGGPLGMAIGASGGSTLGSAANSLLGIDDPMDKTDLALSAGSPLIGSGLAKAGPAAFAVGKRVLPGMGAGLADAATESFKAALQAKRVTKADVDVFRMGMKSSPDFKLAAPNTKQIFDEESAQAAREALQGVPGSDAYLNALNRVIADNPGLKSKISFKDLLTLEEGFNRVKGEKPKEIWAAASGKIIDDIQAAANDPTLHASTLGKAQQGLAAFKNFIQVNNKFNADETLVKAMTTDGGIIKSVQGASDMVKFDTVAFKKFIHTNADLKKAYSPAEIKDIEDSVKNLGYISSPPPQGGDVTSLGKRYGGGGIIGGLVGWGTGAGAMVGAPVGMAVEELMRSAISSDRGRKIVKHLAKEGAGRINALELRSMLGQMTAGAGSGAVAGVTGMGNNNQLNIPNAQ